MDVTWKAPIREPVEQATPWATSANQTEFAPVIPLEEMMLKTGLGLFLLATSAGSDVTERPEMRSAAWLSLMIETEKVPEKGLVPSESKVTPMVVPLAAAGGTWQTSHSPFSVSKMVMS